MLRRSTLVNATAVPYSSDALLYAVHYDLIFLLRQIEQNALRFHEVRRSLNRDLRKDLYRSIFFFRLGQTLANRSSSRSCSGASPDQRECAGWQKSSLIPAAPNRTTERRRKKAAHDVAEGPFDSLAILTSDCCTAASSQMLVFEGYPVKAGMIFIAVQQEVFSLKPSKVIIKKYGNRRLYDTSTSRYINLDEIAALVRNGTEVQVIDVKSGEDLTRVTLTQIIMENAKDQPAGLPLELLRQLVMASDHVGQEFIMWYLKSAFDTYQKLQTAIQGGFSGVQSAALSPLSMMKKLVQGAGRARASLRTANLSNSERAWRSWRPR